MPSSQNEIEVTTPIPISPGAATEAKQDAQIAQITTLLSRIPAALGQTTKANSLAVVPASDYYAPDFDSAVALGLVPGWFSLVRDGLNMDIDTAAQEEIWQAPSYGGPAIRAIPTVPQIHTLASTSANDTFGGTGANAVYLQYIDTNYAYATTTVLTAGLTPVNLPSMALLLTAQCVAFGSGATNAGNITITAATDLTMQGIMPAGNPASNLSAFMVPAGYTALFRGAFGKFVNSAAGALGRIDMEVKLFGSNGWIPLGEIPLRSEAGSLIGLYPLTPPYPIPEKSIVRFIGVSLTNNNSQIGVTLSVLMKQN